MNSIHPFLVATDGQQVLFSMLHGALVVLALFAAMLCVVTHERAIGLFALTLTSFSLWSATAQGYGLQYLWSDAVAFNSHVLHISASLMVIAGTLFSMSYLRVREQCPPWVENLCLSVAVLNAAPLVPLFFGAPGLSEQVFTATATGSIAVQLGVSGWLVMHRSRAARFFLPAFLLFSIGCFASVLQALHAVPPNALSMWGVPLGAVVQALLLTLGLADSMNTRSAQKLVIEREEREAQEVLAHELEKQVAERAVALARANEHIKEQSITDALTGVFNRQHFTETFEVALAGKKREDPLAFCKFDIDHFKSFNDRYGHQAGDQTLRLVAGAVQSELRRSGDVLFRLGGEEFGVLFTAPSPQAAQAFVERLRTAVRGLQISHGASTLGIVTASFGIAWWGGINGVLTADEAYAKADDVLNSAKASGRDRVGVEAA